MIVRQIMIEEVERLWECITNLSEHHNKVSINFKGYYPSRTYEETLETFREGLKSGKSKIAAIEVPEKIVGFCKIDICGEKGKLDYLVVLPEYRSNGYGIALIDWAMGQFVDHHVSQVEVKVVDGNDVIHLYEKYGFKINAHLFWYTLEKNK